MHIEQSYFFSILHVLISLPSLYRQQTFKSVLLNSISIVSCNSAPTALVSFLFLIKIKDVATNNTITASAHVDDFILVYYSYQYAPYPAESNFFRIRFIVVVTFYSIV